MHQNELIDLFDQEGYVLLKDVLDVNGLIQTFANLVGCDKPDDLYRHILAMNARDHKSVYNAMVTVGSSFAAGDLTWNRDLRLAALRLMQATPYNLHNTPLHISVQMPEDTTYDYLWHRESSFYPWAPGVLNMWLPIMASTTEHTGSIGIIPRSHLVKERVERKFNEEITLQIEAEISQEEAKRAMIVQADPGDLLIFHADMIHRTMPNLSKVPRMTGILRVMDQSKFAKPRPLYKALSYVS